MYSSETAKRAGEEPATKPGNAAGQRHNNQKQNSEYVIFGDNLFFHVL